MERITLQKSFVNGLKNQPYVNSEFLVTCRSLRPTQAGLVPFVGIDVDENWPADDGDFLQVEELGSRKIILAADGIYPAGVSDGALNPVNAYASAATLTTPTGVSVVGALAGPGTTKTGLLRIAVAATAAGDVGTEYELKVDGASLSPAVTGTLSLTETIHEVYTDASVAWTIVPADALKSATYRSIQQEALTGLDLSHVKTVEFGDIWFAHGLHNEFAEDEDDVNTFVYTCVPANGTIQTDLLKAGLPTVDFPLWDVSGIAGSSTPAANRLTIRAAERHMGRLYLGGFNAADLAFSTTISSEGAKSWEYFWASFLENSEVELTHEQFSIGPDVVFYSKLNGGDYFWPFAVELAMFSIPNYSAFEDASPFLLDAIRKKEIGFFQVPTTGRIVRMESMQNTLVIFCTDGVYAASAQATDFGMGHQVSRLSDVPALGYTAVHGLGSAVFYINANHKLCVVSQEGLQNLDYAVHLKDLALPVYINYDSEHDDLYISDQARCFVLTRTGLGEYGAHVSSFIGVSGGLVGYAGTQVIANERVQALVCTETLDFGERMLKDIHSLELGLSNAFNIEYQIQYRADGTGTWQSSPWTSVYDTSGFATPMVSGHDLRIRLRFELSGYDQEEYTKLEYVNVIWKRGDRHNFRLQQRRHI